MEETWFAGIKIRGAARRFACGSFGFRSFAALAGILAASGAAAPAAALGQVFSYTGTEQTYVVPAGVTQVHVVVDGASGGFVASVGGGLGAEVSADLPIPAGQTVLYVEVGGTGDGFNGGGAPNGGDASDVRLLPRAQSDSLNSRVIVAGGGGGSGLLRPAGGTPALTEAAARRVARRVRRPPAARAVSRVPAAGSGGAGSLGQGGAGANGGGGGGGYYGGGGGAVYQCGGNCCDEFGAGGGGSSYAAPQTPPRHIWARAFPNVGGDDHALGDDSAGRDAVRVFASVRVDLPWAGGGLRGAVWRPAIESASVVGADAPLRCASATRSTWRPP